MNFRITLPKTNLSMVEWFIKHQVSAEVCSAPLNVVRALDSQIKHTYYE